MSCKASVFRVVTVLFLATVACTNGDRAGPLPRATKQGECAWPASMDAVAAAPGNHRVLLENDRVRVLEITVAPGEREPLHAHCLPGVSYEMYAGKSRDYDAKGDVVSEVKESLPESQFPMTSWTEPIAPHSAENLDTRPMHLLRIELKQ
jgi:hypothetical protein